MYCLHGSRPRALFGSACVKDRQIDTPDKAGLQTFINHVSPLGSNQSDYSPLSRSMSLRG
jgi:hypothetical protein